MLVHRPARVGSARPCAANSTGTSSPRPHIDILAVILACAASATATRLPAQTPRAAAPDNASEYKLPDAPLPRSNRIQPAPYSALLQPSLSTPTASVPLRACPYDQTHARACRVHWKQLFISSTIFITWQNTANLYSGYWYRYETTHGDWAARYAASVTGYKYSVWSDGNPWLDDYIGHPFMGAITNALWIQNDPKGMTLAFSNTRPYWISRLRALEFSTIYGTEWKLGPVGEAGVGHMGDHLAADNGRISNETGFVSLVTTPVGGTLWTVSEDILDQRVIRHLEDRSHNPFLLLTYQFLNPARATGNILRFRPPWYRDDRTVKANSFWSDSEPATGTAALTIQPPASAPSPDQFIPGVDQPASSSDPTNPSSAASLDPAHPPAPPKIVEASPGYVLRPAPPPESTPIGGTHELGAWWGLSLFSGSLVGATKDVKYMPIDVRYSYRFVQHPHWALRYAPEITALAMLDWPTPWGAAPFNLRQRAYGSGLSPEGFQLDLLPCHRVQPFFSQDGGFIYFADRVLSPQGSRFMYTVDLGVGVNIFRRGRQAVTIGYRYQHLSNANISDHNPGTDANTFYVGVSRFRDRHPPAR